MRVTRAILESLSRGLFALAVVALLPLTATADSADNDGLYYAVDKAFDTTPRFEGRLSVGYDISNPYLHVLNAQLGLMYLASPFLSVGIEGMAATSSKKQSAVDLEGELTRHGYTLKAYAPDYGVTGLFRVTPFSGLVNLFSSQVIRAEIAALARAGAVHYGGNGFGPSLGMGFEIGLRMKSGFGIVTGVMWDWDKISNVPWQSRTGFRIGPSIRF